MTDSKPSGIRPPSKIGRPCSNLPPRPAVPPSPPRPSMKKCNSFKASNRSFKLYNEYIVQYYSTEYVRKKNWMHQRVTG